jgi:CheY-like chemotaxis protein
LLYVEDNLSNMSLVESILALRPGVTLIPCMQGRLALDLTREHCPDLVLLDLHLPDLGGEEVLRLLQEQESTRDIPVVVLSADASPKQPGRLKAAGAREYLTKPIEVRRFLEVLDEALA